MKSRQVHLYDAIDVGYDDVAGLLAADTSRLFEVSASAGMDGARRAQSALSADLPGLPLGRNLRVRHSAFESLPGRIPLGRVAAILQPSDHQNLFPEIRIDLEIEPVDDGRTLVSLLAMYDPPLGVVGRALDRLVMHQLAASAIDAFFQELCDRIRQGARLEAGRRQMAVDPERQA